MMQRRELFSSLASSFTKKEQGSHIVRPPYFLKEEDFEICKSCDGACQNACKEDIITILEDGSPKLDFSKGGCTYCDECAKACEYEILKIEHKREINAKITIDVLKCISWNQTVCFSCKDVCLDNAINYLGLFRPEIDKDICTNCGFCVGVCPTNAIKVEKWQ